MQDLTDLLGQTEAAGRITKALYRPDAQVVRLTGPAGSGKSHIARLVVKQWLAEQGACLVAMGDEDHSWREFYPLLSGLSGAHADWLSVAATGARSTLQVADGALPTFGAGTSIFDLLSAAFRQRMERVLKPYSAVERDVILNLKRLARNRRLLVVADNAHWWDADSLRLIRDVLAAPLREAIPQLESVVVLLVDTVGEQSVVAPQQFDAFVAMCRDTEQVSRCERERFPAVLQAFGLDEALPDSILGALYSATHGHLKLAEQIAEYAASNAVEDLLVDAGERYIATLVAARFGSLGTVSPRVSDVLLSAAVLGLTFREADLMCLSDCRRPSELRALLDHASSIGFIERSDEHVGFCHDIVRSSIVEAQSSSVLAGLHGKLASCLTILRPGDYPARAQAQLLAGEADAARDMVALAGVAQLRWGVPILRVQRRAASQIPDDPPLVAYLEKMASAYASIGAGDFERPIPSMRTPLPSESMLMAAERNYVAALCLMELETSAGFNEARNILTGWLPSLEDELELRLRFSLLLQQAQVLSQMFDDARETEGHIERQLLPRVTHDHDAVITMHIQNRRAGAVNEPATAEVRIREAVSFFAEEATRSTRGQVELFRSLNNLAVSLLRLGNDTDAYTQIRRAEQIALNAPDTILRLDVLASNAVLAGYRSEAIDVVDAIERQRLIILSPEGSGDKFLHRCNLAAYLLLDGRDDEGADELERLGGQLRDREISETYLIFYYTALTVAQAAVRGDTREALRRHDQMEDFVAGLRWPYAAHVRARQRLLGKVLPTLDPDGTRAQADRALLDVHPEEVGPGWAYFARLMPCCGLSYWSDS